MRTSFETPEYTANADALGTLRLLEAIRILKLEKKIKFYQASTSEIFGNTKIPQNEKTPFAPTSPYAISKLFSYWTVINYRKAYNIFAVNGILFNHEGERRGATFVTRKITRAVANYFLGNKEILYLGNLNAKRDWGAADDYIKTMWMMLQQEEPDDYVISTGKTFTVKQFLEKTFDVAGLSIRNHVKIDKRLLRPQEVPLLLGDSTKAKEKLGWEPKVDFDQLVEMMFESDLRGLSEK